MSTAKVTRTRKPKATEGALVCKEASVAYRVKKPKATEDALKGTAKSGGAKKQKPASGDSWFTSERMIAFLESQCKTRKSTLAFFKRCGLTYNEKGEPVVVPR